jgi:pyridoxamine 5'-phosphate oxidase
VRIESLHLLQRACWEELTRATHEREHGWRIMTLATVESGRAEARSVILRETDPAGHRLVFFTDDRSPKLQQIQAHPQGTLLAWCPRLSWQIRLRVTLRRESDQRLEQSRWARLRESPAAQDYLAPRAPGEPLAEAPGEPPTSSAHFAMVNAQVEALDWLELHPDGHRRARFDATGSRWLQP